ncbi:MAG TPA: hypothetical protein EYH06_08525 [Chromatiales bacterium]|nr:hypothetical protein [Chromatiales bacterium]
MKQKINLRYLKYSDRYLDEMSSIWDRHIQSKEKLCELFSAIGSEEEKDLFLRIGVFYKYLIIEGSYRFSDKTLNVGMSYVDDTYKYIAIFSLIEALETPAKYNDFYQWLQSKKDLSFPVDQKPKAVLDQKYQEYKKEYGSVRAAVRFFERLDNRDKATIGQKLQIRNKSVSLKEIAQLLYNLRSKFVHEAQFVLDFETATSVGSHNGNILVNKLTINDLRTLFERGFLKRFGWNANTQ